VKNFLKTKLGIFMVGLFVCLMAFAFYRVNQRHQAREAAATAEQTKPLPAEATLVPNGTAEPEITAAERSRQQIQQAAYIGSYRQNAGQSRQEQDRNGNTGTRRVTAAKPHEAGTETVQQARPTVASEPAAPPPNFTLRLQGRPASPVQASRKAMPSPDALAEQIGALPSAANAPLPASVAQSADPTIKVYPAALPHPAKPARFLPYGYPIKCELVFTIDSTMEETPLVGLVVSPVYNNGHLIIPAGAELHGTARPQPSHDRLYASSEWVLIFPRDGNKPNGRQLKVRGVALDRMQPDDNGMTWGITDGAFGLLGEVIHTKSNEEMYQFVATALEAATSALQSTHETANWGQTTDKNPRNALLQGAGADMGLIVKKIRAEIEENGDFIRVPAGKQFYFYPQQIIDPDLADISSDIASVR
jgi:hypothetical protein